MLSGIWYEFLAKLNRQMAAQNRHIALVTDNCPSHPRPNSPPKAYCGPPPPVLTHVVLVYLPKNTTPFFQPLDQGIIRSFKASYRRKYAQKMVHYFNEHQKASPQLDILEAIYLIAEAWEELPQKVIYHCWVKAGILPCLSRDSPDHTVAPFEEYIQYLQTSTRFEIHALIDQDCNSLQMEDAADQYLEYDEDAADLSIPASIVSIPQLVTDLANESQLEEATTPELEIVYPPIIAPSQALSHLKELITFFEALPASDLQPAGRNSIPVSGVAQQLRIFHSGVNQYQESRKRQGVLDGWLSVGKVRPVEATSPAAL